MPEPSKITLRAKQLSKNFNRRPIFKDISFELNSGDSVAITGRNGSGKSTLVKIIANVLQPTSGICEIYKGDAVVKKDDYYKYVGFVSPYLNLYDEFSGLENLEITSRIKLAYGGNHSGVLERVGLKDRCNDLLRIYSSGMKQRLKLAFAVLHDPQILILDEPTSNLDKEGIRIVSDIAEDQKKNRILLIATNDDYEKSLCSTEININKLMGTD